MATVKLLAIVERGKGKRNFSCFATESIGKWALMGYGASAREAMEDIKEVAKEYKEEAEANGDTFPDVEFEFRLDVGSFFDYYPLDVTATAKYIGVNPSALRQYVTSIRDPQQKQIDKINDGLKRLAKDIGAGMMITQPAVSYV